MNIKQKLINALLILCAAGGLVWVILALPTGTTETYVELTRTPTPTPTATPTPTPRCKELIVEWHGDEVVVGNTFNTNDLHVYGIFTDDSMKRVYDYTLSTEEITKVGDNSIIVRYQGKVQRVIIPGKEELKVVELIAEYKGKGVIVTNEINKDDIEVYAFYNWPEKDPLKLKSSAFSITPSKVTKMGENTITVKYGDVTPTIEVEGLEKEVKDVECTYLGKGALVGTRLTREDFQVKVTYNDGSYAVQDKFSIVNPRIMDEGDNVITVTWQNYMFDVTVPGIAKDRLADAFEGIGDYDASTVIVMIVSNDKRVKTISVDPVDQKYLTEAVDRVVVTTKFIGFDVNYKDPEVILEFPILTRVTRPDDYDPEKFGVYYTPNRKTIMARVNGEYIDDEQKQYAFYMWEPGTYAILEEISSKLVTSISVLENYITMKKDRTYSLEPVVRPLSAENQKLTYWSSDESVATVSDTGKVTSVGAGRCEIWIESTDGSGIYTIVTVNVKEK